MNKKLNLDVFFELGLIRKGIAIIFRNIEFPFLQPRRIRSWGRRGRGWSKGIFAKVPSEVA